MKEKWRKLGISEKQLLIQAVIVALALVVGHFIPWHNMWMELVFYLILYVVIGKSVLKEAVENSLNGDLFDENFLMVIATIGAFVVHQYPEAVGVMLFYQIGEFFQHMAVHDSRDSITQLLDLRPDQVNLKIGDKVEVVAPETVHVDNVIMVYPGERIPLDGIVLSGTTYLDTAALTGESKPSLVEDGDEVLSGTIVQNGVLEIKVTRDLSESTVSKIMELVENANEKKAVTENFIRRFAKVYTPIVVGLAVLLTVLPPLFGELSFYDALYRALVFLVISCPCALVISIPLGFFGGIGAASRVGTLIKGSNYLEALNNVKTVVFDKTGTLTKGQFSVVGVYPNGVQTKENVLKMAAIAEQVSPHPIAQSIVASYPADDLEQYQMTEIKEIVGKGVAGVYEGKEILVGNQALLAEATITVPQTEYPAGVTLVHVAYDQEYLGALAIADTLKEDAKTAIQNLRQLGVTKVVMLTGDNEAVAQTVANELELTAYQAQLLPQDKLEEVEKLEAELQPNEKLIFVGDGLNDTPVLARADIGVAMGALGSDAAIEAADIVLMTDEPSSIAKVIKVAKRTKKIVWENIFLAIGFKVLFLTLAALGIATMWEAVFADVGVALLAIMNSMRLMRK
ncbi:heavy metal translocating P-type ATPase [Ligilactobacillus ceti]|uniref:Cd(2+)-exporting ATPase n=1 Tax=Ligilactobacillus ceti DSM 22408 TaxID=1122146 RepID=A0A0R2KSM9_9LACO|nr:heavy metal translocating P-type ATPase [Ligilactobacillus ceti]KRN89642.1 zinc-transporting ATPase [Ligilactobacillus ceti DSM 22408]